MMDHPWMKLELDYETSPLLNTKTHLKQFRKEKTPTIIKETSDDDDEFHMVEQCDEHCVQCEVE